MADACVFLMNLPSDGFKALLGSDESATGRFEPPLVNIGVGTDVTIAETCGAGGTPRNLMDVGMLTARVGRQRPGWTAVCVERMRTSALPTCCRTPAGYRVRAQRRARHRHSPSCQWAPTGPDCQKFQCS